jgi:hypothetical protein
MPDRFLVRFILSASLMCVPIVASGQAPAARVPFVGCRSDGQIGPVKAPPGKSKVLPIDAKTATRLAYYKADEGYGVLAPRGWYCFGTYGSNGENLYVSKNPIRSADLLSTQWKGFRGPAIQASYQNGDTSGRFEVARMMARVFPAHRAFVRRVIEEGIEPASSFPFGPYPKDKLTYRSPEMVDYLTPPATDGLGTQSRLLKNADTIRGVAILVGDVPDLAYLAVRLPAEMDELAPSIIQQVEQDAQRPDY